MFWSLAILAYLLGSLSFAILLSRLTGNPDPRMSGSGNAGATNMLRLAGKKLAVLTLLGDLCKGFLPVLLANQLGLPLQQQAWIGVCAVIGHMYPLYFRFRGGKGVATAAGVLLALDPWLGLAVLGVWILIAYTLRYSSLSALVAAATAPLIAFLLWGRDPHLAAVAIIAMALIAKHWPNLQRLMAGNEPKIGGKKKA